MPDGIQRRIATLPTNATALCRHTINGESTKAAHYIVTEEYPEGTYLFRYADDWSFSGDTWHANLQEALEQAEWEFTVAYLDWRDISQAELLGLTK
ncbi:MAG: hypothetical protein NVSMB62_05260 [Acidobacteriaceae bacterium]